MPTAVVGGEEGHRIWGVYVPAAARENFDIGLSLGLWGSPRPRYIRQGDRLVLVHDLKSDRSPPPRGFPRVPLNDFSGVARRLVRATAIGDSYEEHTSVWHDDEYPYRVRLSVEDVLDSQRFDVGEWDDSLVDAVRRSAIGGGMPELAVGLHTPPPGPPFSLESVRSAALARGLILPEGVYASLVAAVLSGKHLILTGPPGTAKTTLAQVVAEVAHRAGLSSGWFLTTATADWTTYETIGGLRPARDGQLEFAPGHFLQALQQNKWLVIDELNRSNFDRAFGQLFTVLSGQSVVLPYNDPDTGRPLALVPQGEEAPLSSRATTIPKSWRILATMNVFDKSLLFEMSFALMRRFAFVEVPAPPEPTYRDLIAREAPSERAQSLTGRLLAVRAIKEIGPALFMDIARYAEERLAIGAVDDGQLAFDAFYSFLLPQFEGIDERQGVQLRGLLRPIVGTSLVPAVNRVLREVLGLQLLGQRPEEPDDTLPAVETEFVVEPLEEQ